MRNDTIQVKGFWDFAFKIAKQDPKLFFGAGVKFLVPFLVGYSFVSILNRSWEKPEAWRNTLLVLFIGVVLYLVECFVTARLVWNAMWRDGLIRKGP